VDWKKREPRFDVVYHFYSFSKNDRIRVKCAAADGEEVPSIASVYLAADWSEREIWDMFGIRFAGHPDLRRILTWEGFHGHPLRKDFPLEGIDTGAAIYPEEWPEGAGPGPNDPNRKVVS
jgi:NADH-quinone oxidoreductase subunit C